MGNLEGMEEGEGKHGVFDEDVGGLVEDPHPPPTDELLDQARPHLLEAVDAEGVEDVVPEAAETAVRRLLHRLLTRRLA